MPQGEFKLGKKKPKLHKKAIKNNQKGFRKGTPQPPKKPHIVQNQLLTSKLHQQIEIKMIQEAKKFETGPSAFHLIGSNIPAAPKTKIKASKTIKKTTKHYQSLPQTMKRKMVDSANLPLKIQKI